MYVYIKKFAINCVPSLGGIKNIDGQMLPKIKQTLMEKLSSKIPEKMEEEGGLKVKCTSVEPGDQGDFFFSLIKELKMVK